MSSQERTQQPTPRRRQKARERGQVSRSNDFVTAVALLAAYAAFRGLGAFMARHLSEASRLCLGSAHAADLSVPGVQALLGHWLAAAALTLGPLAGIVLVAGIAANLAQTGFLLSAQALTPDFTRVNPATGLKRLLSLRGLVDTAKSCAKIVAIGSVAAAVLRAHLQALMAVGAMPLGAGLPVVSGVAAELFLKCALALLVIGLLDYTYQRWSFEKSLRMTNEEVRQETKESDGDPQIRSRRARRRRDMLQQRITPEAAQASVVIVNPTHIAVALRYNSGLAPAPRVVAKGERAVARRIVALAEANGIPVVQNIPLARALYKSTAVGSEIPAPLYKAVAEILAAIYRAAAERRHRRRL
jgi:flagellar biosynthetic protein FlhB